MKTFPSLNTEITFLEDFALKSRIATNLLKQARMIQANTKTLRSLYGDEVFRDESKEKVLRNYIKEYDKFQQKYSKFRDSILNVDKV